MSKTMAEVLADLWDKGNGTGLDGWVGPGRGTYPVDDEAVHARERDIATAKDMLTAAGFGLVADAKGEAWDECEAASYEIRITDDGKSWEPVKVNPYRSAVRGEG